MVQLPLGRLRMVYILLFFMLCFCQSMAGAAKADKQTGKSKAHKASSPQKSKHAATPKKAKKVVQPKAAMKESFDFFYEQKGVTYKRPKWSNDITIELDKKVGSWSMAGLGWSTLHVSGTIIPMNYKSNRPPTPDITFDGTKRHLGGCTGYQKGHIIGLELGGPNVQQNIAPQTASWQAAGQWRELEKDILKHCEDCYGWSHNERLPVAQANVDTRKKKNLCEINMWIKFWKDNIPSNYWGYLQCDIKKRVATAAKVKFEISQPAAPYQAPYKFGGEKKDCAANSAVVPLDLFTPKKHYDGGDGDDLMVHAYDFESMRTMAVLSVFGMLMIAACITCLCGFATSMCIQRFSRYSVTNCKHDLNHVDEI